MQVKTLLPIGALFLSALQIAHAQTSAVHFGAKTGMSLAVLDGEVNTNANFKPGLVAGVLMRWKPSARIAIQPELVISQQGAKNTGYATGHSFENKVNLTYLNMPVLLKIYLGDLVNVQLGPQLGVLLSGRHTGQIGYISSTYGNNGYVEVNDDVKKDYGNDLSLCGGAGVDLKNGLLFAARLNYGMTDINNNADYAALRKRLNIGGLHNRGIEFSVGYVFGVVNK